MLLTLARLFVAPEPSAAPTDAATTPDASDTSSDSTDEAVADDTGPLLLIDFRQRARSFEGSPPAYDLRNPFLRTTGTTMVQASAPAPTTSAPKRRRANVRRPDLRDPFAEPPRKRRAPAKPAEDLRNPFKQPAPVLPKCPETGGVPIQRPDTVRAGCAQASLGVVLAHR